MPTTRSTARSPTSPLVGDEKTKRISQQLVIDGTAALKGGKIDRRPSTVRKYGGASYEVDEDGISWARTGVKCSAATAELAPPPPPPPASKRASRQRQPTSQPTNSLLRTNPPRSPISNRTSKKRKSDVVSDTADEDFRKETLRQLKRVKIAPGTHQAADLKELLPALRSMKTPRRQYVVRRAQPRSDQALGDATGDKHSTILAPDAYDMTADEVRTLLQGSSRINAPVFVTQGAPTGIFDPEIDTRRPVEQLLDFLPDLDEDYEYQDKAASWDLVNPTKSVTVAGMKERFVNQQHPQQFPWNFPEIPFPMPAPEMPGFLRHPSCNLLIDIIRHIQYMDTDQICPPTCHYYGVTADRCPEHWQTGEEVVDFQLGVQHFLGTVMMAEAGAYTPRHYDALGFGTFIACYEGEIGFAYQTTPPTLTPQARRKGSQSQKWLFKVMRPGDSVYMPPGTFHMVFRQPFGHQTLATAIRVLRYCDVADFLKLVSAEFDNAAGSEDPKWFSRVVRALVKGIRHYINKARAHNGLEKFGGAENVRAAEKLLLVIDKKLKKLWTSLKTE